MSHIDATLHFRCMGCFRAEDVETKIRREFKSFNGKGYGFGRYQIESPNPEELAPAGWIAFDMYTNVTYCPDCWKSITAPVIDGELVVNAAERREGEQES